MNAFTLWEAGAPPSKQAVVTAALELFVAQGYEATTIRQIAERAGYTNPALFKFFESKEALGLYVFERAWLQLLQALGPHFADDGGVEEVARRWVEAFFSGVLREGLPAFLFVHEHLAHFWPRAEGRLPEESLFSLMRGWLRRARRRGDVSRTVPVEVQMAAVSGFFHQLARMVFLGQARAADPALRKGAVEVLVRVLS